MVRDLAAVVVASLMGVSRPHVPQSGGMLLGWDGQGRWVGRHYTGLQLTFLWQTWWQDVLWRDTATVMQGCCAVRRGCWVTGPASILVWGRTMVQRSASPQHPHWAGALMVLLYGYQWSPVAGGGAAGGEDRSSHSWDCSVSMRRIEEGSTAGAVPVQTGSICLMELDRWNPENSNIDVNKWGGNGFIKTILHI